MQDVVNDIETLEHALVAFTEGASDEKRAALFSLEKMLTEKQDALAEFEKTCPSYDIFGN